MTLKIASLVTRVYQDGVMLHTYAHWQTDLLVLPPLKGAGYVRVLAPLIPKIAYIASYNALALRLSILPNILQVAVVNRVEIRDDGSSRLSTLYPVLLISYIAPPRAPMQQALEDIKEVVKALCQ